MHLLLDTHALIWAAQGARQIGRRTRALLDRATGSDAVLVSAVSFWEVARLVHHGRVRIASEPAAWRGRILESGFQEVALDGDIAIRAAGLGGLSGDPIDRFIVATALVRGATVVTADRMILGWSGSLARQDASK